jgi:hypothetical protein
LFLIHQPSASIETLEGNAEENPTTPSLQFHDSWSPAKRQAQEADAASSDQSGTSNGYLEQYRLLREMPLLSACDRS